MALDLDIEWDDALALLSEPETGKNVFSRRAFLQAAAAGVAGTALATMPGVLRGREAWAAGPVKPNDGILVTLAFFGGNDGLNTLVPYGNARVLPVALEHRHSAGKRPSDHVVGRAPSKPDQHESDVRSGNGRHHSGGRVSQSVAQPFRRHGDMDGRSFERRQSGIGLDRPLPRPSSPGVGVAQWRESRHVGAATHEGQLGQWHRLAHQHGFGVRDEYQPLGEEDVRRREGVFRWPATRPVGRPPRDQRARHDRPREPSPARVPEHHQQRPHAPADACCQVDQRQPRHPRDQPWFRRLRQSRG